MRTSDKKLSRLYQAARLYYEQEKSQHEIAAELGVSRPMISRMLQEAKDLGIVRIQIHNPLTGDSYALGQLCDLYAIRGGVVVPGEHGSAATDRAIARTAIRFLQERETGRLGLGWDSIIGALVDELERDESRRPIAHHVFPLIGNLGEGNRYYHSNELVRVFAQQTKSHPHYLHAPAFFSSAQELAQYQQLDSFSQMQQLWADMDTALINIGNYPSTPDFATKARFQNLLNTGRAVGRLLGYYYNEKGEIIRSDTDYTLQVPLTTLVRCPTVIAVCSANVTPAALMGALNTGLIHHLIAPDHLVTEVLQLSAL